MTDFLL